MDIQGPPNRSRYQLTRGLIGLDNDILSRHEGLDDVILSRQEVCTRRHLANAHSLTGPAGSSTRRLFLSFGGTGRRKAIVHWIGY